MFKLFDPQIKVQKNREVLRKTDMRVAKYSRRGLISNFLVFLLCLVGGQIYQQYADIAILLTAGLLIFTLLRAYFLFRFESIYPRGPAKWRNAYFVVTLLGAFWWGLTLASITYLLGVEHEVPLLWLYTAVFFSTTAHAFAPYHRFLSIYQFLGLIPGALAVFFSGDLISLVYGVVIIIFFGVINHQSKLISESYWERLEANYLLAKRALSLEEEKQETLASAQLSREYMNLLRNELYELLHARRGDRRSEERKPSNGNGSQNGSALQRRPRLELLYRNVNDFQQILSKEFKFENRVFNPRSLVQALIARQVAYLESHELDVASLISASVPVRIIGDAERISQVISILLRSLATQSQSHCYILVEVDFVYEREDTGNLILIISRQISKTKRLFFQEQTQKPIEYNLDLALAKGIIEEMGGNLELSAHGRQTDGYIRFQSSFKVPANSGQFNYEKPEFRHKKLLLVHSEPRLLDGKRHELDALGFDVETESQFKSAVQQMELALKSGQPFDGVVFYTSHQEEHWVQFSRELAEHPDLKFSPQIAIGSKAVWDEVEWRDIWSNPIVTQINKPSGYFEFELNFKHVFARQEEESIEEKNLKLHDEFHLLLFSLDKSVKYKELTKNLPFKIRSYHDKDEMKEAIASLSKIVILLCTDDQNDYLELITEFEAQFQGGCICPIIVLGYRTQEEIAYCKGADYFFDVEHSKHDLLNVIDYWAGFYQQNLIDV